ncbi:polyketide cyclase / dehydrase and lipid transport [Phytoactinopolyspora sp. XMNu-373]|uniref:Polyketide cyclase / dehydrase and lipid transport n=2 Tax=Phytoactinopolyspora mesophila TaxID=2650750 RepID=A0A7K3M1Z6_9ACTN|nr:polyketide cyclase / dehydrase and lipid transport [Phytoactinopolyspora mesophila]
MDETFVVADRSALAAVLADPGLWRRWWPRLQLTVVEDRGRLGTRWTVRGELVGTAEIWLEPWHDGVIVHWFLRAEPAAPDTGLRWRRPPDPTRIRERYVASFKRHIHALKDELDAGRMAGHARPSKMSRRPAPPAASR